MRFMLSFRVPTEKANATIKDGTFPQTLQSIMEDLKAEAAYFNDVEGARGGYLIVNMDDASQLPAMAEPPAERLAYVLHDMFSVPFDQIAYGPPERHFGLRIAPK